MTAQIEILDGLDAELLQSQRAERFIIEDRVQEERVWRISVSPAQAGGRLDESLEGAVAWWPDDGLGSGKGTADVLAVVPEEDLVVLRFATGRPPARGHEIRIYPIQYLRKLKELWTNDQFAARALTWWDTFAADNAQFAAAPDPGPFRWLRAKQRQAFMLASWKTAFLWGPPGTGKTTTLGAILARAVQQFPGRRILLLSTTNSAVDQALIAVDIALKELTGREPQPSSLRRSCLRIGAHFDPKYYEGREHLLPTKDLSLLKRLIELRKNEPERINAAQYARWKANIEAAEGQIRQQAIDVLRRARIAAMTTTAAVYRYSDFGQLPKYDLIVFDEASQVSIVHALTVAGLGRQALFAGDPNQLAPVVQSEDRSAQLWLGRSPFERMPRSHASACMLDEQSRMAEAINDLVSHTFYESKLRVATDSRNDPKWRSAREPIDIRGYGSRNAYVIETHAEARYIPQMGGNARFETAEHVIALLDQLTRRLREEEILVITPYRAQRTLIRQKLRSAGYKRVQVSTVHRAQGRERNTVIFDPVTADNAFLNNDQLGRRLINVAVSRAQARLFMFVSPENRRHPCIAQIAGIIENAASAHRAGSVRQFVSRPDFPDCVIGKAITIARPNGSALTVQVTGFDETGNKLVGINCHTGERTALSIRHLRSAVGC